MKSVRFQGLDKDVSVIVQGAMGLLNLDDAGAFACLDAAFEAGIVAFDSAHVYAAGDRTVDGVLGAWVRDRGVRGQIVLMAKGGHPEAPDWTTPRANAEGVAFDVADSLDRMGLDHLDVWSFHRDDPSVEVGELVEATNAEIAAGRITTWGVSNWRTDRIQAAIDYADAAGLVGPVANSAHYSLVDQVIPQWDDVLTLTGEAGETDRNWHLASGLPVVAWSALSGGVLSPNLSRAELAAMTDDHMAGVFRSYDAPWNWARRERAEAVAERMGVSLADVAIAWLLQSDLAPLAIVGGANPDEVRANARAAGVDLTATDHAAISGDPFRETGLQISKRAVANHAAIVGSDDQ